MSTTVPKHVMNRLVDRIPFAAVYSVTCSVMFLGGALFGVLVWR